MKTKIQKNLNRWKEKFLSMVNRVCMLRSVLSSISLFCISFYACDPYYKEVRNLWDLEKDDKKIAWVAKTCESKEKGELRNKRYKAHLYIVNF